MSTRERQKQINETGVTENERQHSKSLTDILTKSKFDPSRPQRTLESEWLRLRALISSATEAFQGSIEDSEVTFPGDEGDMV